SMSPLKANKRHHHATITQPFNIETVQVRKWLNLKQKLMEASPHVRRLSNGFRPKYAELEVVLSQWVRDDNGNYVYLSDESSDINVQENIETHFNPEKEDSIREYEDDYYEAQELNHFVQIQQQKTKYHTWI
ncbi:30275_t:CDS:2, partial [Gigaspora margarita]